MQRLSVDHLRLSLFIALVVLAPMSKFPYIALPAFNFTSFRLGLYQLLTVAFIALCIVPTIKAAKTLYQQNKTAFISVKILGLVTLLGLFGAYYKARSLLLIASIILLLMLVMCAWWYVATLSKAKSMVRIMLYAAVGFGVLGIIQFTIATFTSVPVVCTGCTEQVFGFPRINVFAAEPQFLANALLPLFFVALAVFYQHKTRLSAWALSLSSITLGLTFSRGAFVALFAGICMFVIILALSKNMQIKNIIASLVLVVVAFLGSFILLVGAASYTFKDTPNITYNTVRTIFSHLSGGFITLPAKQVVVLAPANPSGVPAPPVITPNAPVIVATVVAPTPQPTSAPIANDVVEESGQERVAAAKLALQAWQNSVKTIVVGVGAGNLGPFVIANIDKNVPNNLTVYIYYVLLLAELGLMGLMAFLLLFASVFYGLHKAYWRGDKDIKYLVVAVILFSFLVQYLFFGSYINVAYIWLWIGIGLGLAGLPLKKGYN